nr:hypothetical protein [Mycolicibacterium insubricum]
MSAGLVGFRRIRLLPALLSAVLMANSTAAADPGDGPTAQFEQPQPLPVVTPVADTWQPIFPFPFDLTRNEVTDAEINAEREMCQWYDAQYDIVRRQIAGLNNLVIRNNGNFDAPGVPEHVAIVVGNIDQSVGFLAPRVQTLTQSQNHAGDLYFPLYQGESFYGLWQQMSNVTNGLNARQPNWFTGPSYQRMLHWGSKINRSHVCRV